MWWVLRPARRRTCSVMPAAVAKRLPEVLGQLRVERRVAERQHLAEGHVVARRTGGPTGRGRPRPAPRRAGTGRWRSGARRPCRRAPRGTPRRAAMPTSSTVWWPSTCEVARGLHREVEAAVAAELVEHVVEERQPGGDRRPRPWARRGRGATAIVVSLVVRCLGRRRELMHRTSSRAARKRVVLVGVPMVTRRQPSRRGHDEQSRTSTDRSSSACHTVVAVAAVGPEQHEVGARRPHRRRGRSARRGRPAGPAPRRARRPAAPSRRRSRSARRPATCLTASRWYGSTTFSSSATSHGGPDAGSRAGRRPSTTSWRTCG